MYVTLCSCFTTQSGDKSSPPPPPSFNENGESTKEEVKYDVPMLEKQILKLRLSPQDLKTCLKLVKEDKGDIKDFFTAVDCMCHMQDMDKHKMGDSLTELFGVYMKSDNDTRRQVFGEFLTLIGFVACSYKTYKSVLKEYGLEYFGDKILEGLVKDMSNVEFSIFYGIRINWWNWSDSSTQFCLKCSSDGLVKEFLQDCTNLIGATGEALVGVTL